MVPCRHPWHYLVDTEGRTCWFRWLKPFGPSKIHYWIGPEPKQKSCRRIYDFGQGEPFTCSACGEIIDGRWPDPPEAPKEFVLPVPVRRSGPRSRRSPSRRPATFLH
jgi:hypothetical protein